MSACTPERLLGVLSFGGRLNIKEEQFKTPNEAITKYGKPQVKIQSGDKVVVLNLQQMPSGLWKYL